ncbi:Barwin-like endoglucanase [Mycena sanguinolenta]|uniref:Barwin-like endoglucanase n=1 Tax=Mycena sanguinolenta TaxID=230812 RepID=A0A8H7CX34_9AGAR|nr:Barwin-like endoglucanase [Mycena sanguinolenta]
MLSKFQILKLLYELKASDDQDFRRQIFSQDMKVPQATSTPQTPSSTQYLALKLQSQLSSSLARNFQGLRPLALAACLKTTVLKTTFLCLPLRALPPPSFLVFSLTTSSRYLGLTSAATRRRARLGKGLKCWVRGWRSFASLAAFAAVAVAQVELEDSAHLYQPDGPIGACGNPIQDSDLAIALPPNHWNNGTFCGVEVLVIKADDPTVTFIGVVQDFCTTCAEKQIELTPAGFHELIGISPNNTVEVFYILPHK